MWKGESLRMVSWENRLVNVAVRTTTKEWLNFTCNLLYFGLGFGLWSATDRARIRMIVGELKRIEGGSLTVNVYVQGTYKVYTFVYR